MALAVGTSSSEGAVLHSPQPPTLCCAPLAPTPGLQCSCCAEGSSASAVGGVVALGHGHPEPRCGLTGSSQGAQGAHREQSLSAVPPCVPGARHSPNPVHPPPCPIPVSPALAPTVTPSPVPMCPSAGHHPQPRHHCVPHHGDHSTCVAPSPSHPSLSLHNPCPSFAHTCPTSPPIPLPSPPRPSLCNHPHPHFIPIPSIPSNPV